MTFREGVKMELENNILQIQKDLEENINDEVNENSYKHLPLVSVRGSVVFPGTVIHFDLEQGKSEKALNYAMDDTQTIIFATQKDSEDEPTKEDLYNIGCEIKIKQTLKMPDGKIRVMGLVQSRVEILDYIREIPFYEVHYEEIHCVYEDNAETKAMIRLLMDAFSEYMKNTRKFNGEFNNRKKGLQKPDELIDYICTNVGFDMEIAQEILGERNLQERLRITYEALIEEMNILDVEHEISKKVHSEMAQNNKEYILREQMRVIQDQLGEGEEEDPIGEYIAKLEALEVSEEVEDRVKQEIKKLQRVPQGSQEANVIESYLDWVVNLPWNTKTKETLSVPKARRTLNQDHYGLDKVKERILEHLSVLKLTKDLKSPIMCLVGPPGVGKTSIAKSIARALNRKYVRMSLGGLHDEAEIRGHRRTYVGAIPGRIISNIKQVGSKNPLVLLDEIDKLSQDFRGDPASALLEVLDPEQNSTFMDNYLELPFDLSDVLFLTTANSLGSVPHALLDRMEIIEVNGYVGAEKYEIAKRYLVPKQIKIHGLDGQIKFNKKAIEAIIDYYTRESGVRELERQIAKVCRSAAKEIVENGVEQVAITEKNIVTYLGRHRYSYDSIENKKEIGLVNGLAWTSVGGETLEIEVIVVEGSGKIVITGQLGDVMQESAKAAITYIRSQAETLGIAPEFYEKMDMHLHVPEGAVPKDGPSAGITMTTAFISALTKQAVPQNLAMTGEITLRGRVLPIGGLREKLTAAQRAGIKTVIIPKENIKDLEEVPEMVTSHLTIHSVERMEEVTALVFGKKNESK